MYGNAFFSLIIFVTYDIVWKEKYKLQGVSKIHCHKLLAQFQIYDLEIVKGS